MMLIGVKVMIIDVLLSQTFNVTCFFLTRFGKLFSLSQDGIVNLKNLCVTRMLLPK